MTNDTSKPQIALTGLSQEQMQVAAHLLGETMDVFAKVLGVARDMELFDSEEAFSLLGFYFTLVAEGMRQDEGKDGLWKATPEQMLQSIFETMQTSLPAVVERGKP